MPKYYCDYCDTYLTHDSPSVRKTHCSGRKHKENVKTFYQKWMEEQAQNLIDSTTAAFNAGKLPSNPFANSKVMPGAAVPPPASLQPSVPLVATAPTPTHSVPLINRPVLVAAAPPMMAPRAPMMAAVPFMGGPRPPMMAVPMGAHPMMGPGGMRPPGPHGAHMGAPMMMPGRPRMAGGPM